MDNELEINLLLRADVFMSDQVQYLLKKKFLSPGMSTTKLLREKPKLHLDRTIFLKGNFIEHLAGFSSNGKKGLKIILDDKIFDNDKGINIKQA